MHISVFWVTCIVLFSEMQNNKKQGHIMKDEIHSTSINRKRTARAVLTGMCYSAGSAMRHGSSSLTRLTGQSAMTPGTWRR
ncbi:hypothetical protein AOY60_09800 [Escherichia coli]|nr:hypothetical protein [Escherichia coli]EFX6076453.1 hypothetical protein [Shigella boydii]EEX0622107.1 hypothetical protein [Escherichia coli]EFF2234639.1 hypothetical protein [Escherichia coli]EFN9203147.1 hypothetical protein [Escherichia coli]